MAAAAVPPAMDAVVPPASAPVTASMALYVGDLHHSVSEGTLLDFFAKEKEVVGIESVRVCRDSNTGTSLGYGYVNFTTADQAFKVMEKYNHSPLNGKPIRIMISCRDSDARKSGIGNVFVKNLIDTIDNVKLHEMFAKFGTILSCKVEVSDGKSKGYGFVQFDSQESADSAIEKLNGSSFGGKQIYVGHFIKKSERLPASPDTKYTNLYMKNLDEDITEELLRLKFSEFGKITNLAIAKDNNGNSKGFAFVNFENPDDAKQAMVAMNGLLLGSKALYVARAQKKAERQQILHRLYEERKKERIRKNLVSNVYVKNIDDSVDDDVLREHFGKCGTITSAKVMCNEKGISKGYGFVCFSTPDEANEAVKTLHGFMLHGKPLYVAIAQRKEERHAQLQLQFAHHIAGLAGSSGAVIPQGYPLYYSPHPGIVPQIPSRHGFMYPPFGVRPGWGPSGFAPSRPAFQQMPLSVIPTNAPRQHRQNRGRMSGHVLPLTGQSIPYVPHLQQQNHTYSSKEYINQQVMYVPNGQLHSTGNGSLSPPASSNAHGADILSSLLAAASRPQQKQILGERLFPLVQKLKADLAAKITGMLLEMDNSELLLLLDSPESLASKVEEAVQVLKRSSNKNNVGGQESSNHSNLLSAGVAVI